MRHDSDVGPTGRRSSRSYVLALAAALCSAGCAQVFYAKTPPGVLKGKLTVEWIAPNQFIYRPDRDDPLSFTTSDGRRIQPELMYTDGGSIPRIFWSGAGLGPWDYAPGYIIHDWLFQQHHCQTGDWQSVDFAQSAKILAEGLKTQMEKANKPEPGIVYVVYEAVRSPVAEALWNRTGCINPPTTVTPQGGGAPPVVLLRIDIK